MTLTKHEQDELIQLRRFFHQNPECSMQETRTASFIENELQKCETSSMTKITQKPYKSVERNIE